MKVTQAIFAILVLGVRGSAPTEDEAMGSTSTFDLQMLLDWNHQLRSKDKRLMRPWPTDHTSAKQLEICPPKIRGLVHTLNSHEKNEGLELRAEAAHTLHLCTTNNPGNRAAIGNIGHDANATTVITTVNATEKGPSGPVPFRHPKESPHDNVHAGLTKLITDSMAVYSNPMITQAERISATKGIAEASQAIWILAFNNAHNHLAFLAAGTVEALVSVVMTCHIDFEAKETHESVCSQAVMWSLAALQNMAATYCNTPDGHCEWIWNDNDKLVIQNSVPQSGAGAKVRSRLVHQIKNSFFGEILVTFLQHGPVDKPHSSNYPWPSLGVHDLHMHRPSIVPWAAAGLIKNLALNEEIGRHFKDTDVLHAALCAMSKTSPDWLEESKATDALYYLGDLGEDCYDPRDDCTDLSGWIEKEENLTCTQYAEERWCAEHGNLSDFNGVSANEACCFCGGGTRDDEHDEL